MDNNNIEQIAITIRIIKTGLLFSIFHSLNIFIKSGILSYPLTLLIISVK